MSHSKKKSQSFSIFSSEIVTSLFVVRHAAKEASQGAQGAEERVRGGMIITN
jgi:hypothetical protein